MDIGTAPDSGPTGETSAWRPRDVALMALAAAILALPVLAGGGQIHGASAAPGPGSAAAVSAALAAVLVVLSAVDLAVRRLPDVLTLPLALAGLAWTWATAPDMLAWHGLAAIAGYGLLWGVARLYRRARGRPGLGLGDAKLLGVAGAWVGPQGLTTVLLVGSLAALGVVAVMRWRGRAMTLASAIPFGPFLALGLWVVWLYGPLA